MMMKYFSFINFRLILTYIIVWLILFLTNNTSTSDINDFCLTNMGGLTIAQTTNGLDIFRLLRWNLTIVFPIIVSLIYASREFSSLYIFTVIRYKSMGKWWKERLVAIFANNYNYLFIGLVIAGIINVDTISQLDIKSALLIYLLFSLFTLSVSLTCVTFFIMTKSYKLSIVVYLLFVGFASVFGLLDINYNKYAFGCFGMLMRSNYINNDYGFSVFIATIIMIALIIFNLCIQFLFLKTNKV